MTDNVGVDCETCREALSARLDGEAEPVPAAETDAHLADCAACRAWQDGAATLTRSLRLRPATPTPDLAAAVVAAAPPVVRTRGWYPRAGLAGVAVAQLTLGLSQVLGTTPAAAQASGHGIHGSTGTHLFNESTAWNLALGLGLLWAALRPRSAAGLLPVVAAFVTVLAAFSTRDLIAGQATATRVTSHAVLVLGLALLLLVRRTHRTPDGTSTPVPTAPGTTGAPAAPDTPRADPEPPHHPRLRPVSRRGVA
ncbi:hypothetical protein CKY47_33270 [Saccharothrix yanglingensis]|uniref:Putative zinc-finger domain-containing protein n=1 Tax=Saccharothrix yanglingensis TaxID=659496 RepID=A0ABU0X9B9_9PSEU|nr:hypothetical protein [Saccharothrix yanglingensis]